MKVSSAARQTAPPPSEAGYDLYERMWFRIPADAHTLEGFREWATSPAFPPYARATLLNGEIFIDMSNEDPEMHVLVKTVIAATLYPFCRDQKLGRLYQDGMLVANKKAKLASNPDCTFVSWKTLREGKARFIRRKINDRHFRDLEGTPDWVMEVVSDSSVEKDLDELRVQYFRAGVAEYWIVDARGEEIDFRILHRHKNRYGAAPIKEGWQKSRVFEREFRLTRQQVELDLWDYTLEMREFSNETL